jgi:dTMP kinase
MGRRIEIRRKLKHLIFSFEGLDASGKNTQSRLLYQALSSKRTMPVESLSFPDYTTKIGSEIQAFLTGRRQYDIETRHLLFAANRTEHLNQIKSWLAEEKCVVINRYCESNVAYGVASGLSGEWLRAIESLMPKSDFVFFLKINPEISSSRRAHRDRFEENVDFLKKVSEVYNALAEANNWITIDGARSVQEIQSEIVKFAESLIAENRPGLKKSKLAWL